MALSELHISMVKLLPEAEQETLVLHRFSYLKLLRILLDSLGQYSLGLDIRIIAAVGGP